MTLTVERDGRVGVFVPRGGWRREAKSVATGVERQKSLGSIGGSRSRFGFVLDDGEGAVDEDTNTQTHTQTGAG